MNNSTVVEQIGILESYEPEGDKWVRLTIDGTESTMKLGDLFYLSCSLVEEIWGGSKHRREVDDIRKNIPEWPKGSKVKHRDGRVVAIWVPTKNIWLREKRR